MPRKMFTPAEDHATIAIASALKRLCRCGAVPRALGDVGVAGRRVGRLLVVVGVGDEGVHVVDVGRVVVVNVWGLLYVVHRMSGRGS